MAAGTTIKLKRKAGAFTGGDLAAGEAGIDTTNNDLYFSKEGTTVTQIDTSSIGGAEAYIGDLQLNIAELAYELSIAKNQSVLELSDGVAINYDDTAGIDAGDSSDYYHDSVNEVAHNKLEPIGGAAYRATDGSSQYLTFGTNLSMSNRDWSLSFWYKGTESTDGASIFGNDSGGVGAQIVIQGSKLRYKPWSGTNVDSTTSIDDDAWHHCVVVYHSGNTCDVWVDGSKEADGVSTSISGSIAQIMRGYSGKYFAGKVSDIRWFTATALDSSAVADLYAGSEVATGITSHWIKTATDDLTDQEGSNDLTNSSSTFSATGGPLEGAGNTVNMILVSTDYTASAAPDDAAFTMQFIEPDSDITLNTDLTVEISRDGGTTYTSLTLVEARTSGTNVVANGTVDISAQPSGTTMKSRIKAIGGTPKEMRIVAHTLQIE